MYILAVETTGPECSVALIDENGNTFSECSGDVMSHLENLIPMTEQLLTENGIKKSEISAVAASIGPGSFTGIRIGVTTARTLSQALAVPAVSVPTLDSFRMKCDGTSLVVPVFNARRGQVYGAVFDENGEDILKPCPCMLTDVFKSLKRYSGNMKCSSVTFYGDGIDAYETEIDQFADENSCFVIVKADKPERYQNAVPVAELALRKYRKGEMVTYEELLPDYMRITEAEQKLRDGTLAKERAAKMAKFRSR